MHNAVTCYDRDLLWGPLKSLQIDKRLHLMKLRKAGWTNRRGRNILKLLQTKNYRTVPFMSIAVL